MEQKSGKILNLKRFIRVVNNLFRGLKIGSKWGSFAKDHFIDYRNIIEKDFVAVVVDIGLKEFIRLSFVHFRINIYKFLHRASKV
jgi:hypothetical protein